MTTRQIVEEVITQYLDIMTHTDAYDRNIGVKVDLIAAALEKKLNDKRSVDEVKKSFAMCYDCNTPGRCRQEEKCLNTGITGNKGMNVFQIQSKEPKVLKGALQTNIFIRI